MRTIVPPSVRPIPTFQVLCDLVTQVDHSVRLTFFDRQRQLLVQLADDRLRFAAGCLTVQSPLELTRPSHLPSLVRGHRFSFSPQFTLGNFPQLSQLTLTSFTPLAHLTLTDLGHFTFPSLDHLTLTGLRHLTFTPLAHLTLTGLGHFTLTSLDHLTLTGLGFLRLLFGLLFFGLRSSFAAAGLLLAFALLRFLAPLGIPSPSSAGCQFCDAGFGLFP
jgi:hypothetical protein